MTRGDDDSSSDGGSCCSTLRQAIIDAMSRPEKSSVIVSPILGMMTELRPTDGRMDKRTMVDEVSDFLHNRRLWLRGSKIRPPPKNLGAHV